MLLPGTVEAAIEFLNKGKYLYKVVSQYACILKM